MRTKLKGAAAALIAVILIVFVIDFATRVPRSESTPQASDQQVPADEHVAALDPLAAGSSAEDPAIGAVGPSPVAAAPADGVSAVAGTHVLRVILEGITEEDARKTTVTVTGVSENDSWPAELWESWPCEGPTSEFGLDPFLARVADHGVELDVAELQVEVDHPLHLLETTRVPLTSGVALENSRTLLEVRVRLTRVEFWPEFTLSVRDANTLAHLEDVDLHLYTGPGMAHWGRNDYETSSLLGDGLRSPIALMGGREAEEDTVAGLALSPTAGESPRLVELPYRPVPSRGIRVFARAPGYAWGSTSLDVSEGDRELLLEPAATLEVRLTNVQLESYAALETVPMLCVYWIREDGGNQYAHFEPLDETLETEGLQLENLAPGGYRVTVELGGGSWTEQPVLAREELSEEQALAAGETRTLVLALADPPAAPERATLAGVVSFPAPTTTWGEENARLQLYFQPTQRWRKPDVEFSLADLPRVGGTLPTWSFRVEDVPVGMYRVQLLPFLNVWMIDVPAGGREDLELRLPELAEVIVETVDGETGERVPRDELWYRYQEPVPHQRQRDLARADTEEPGRFRFWAAPGTVRVWPKWPNGSEREYGGNGKVLDLVPGLQSVRFELGPIHALHFEFREDGTTLPTGPLGLQTTRDIRPVDHEGRVTRGGLQRDMRVEVSAPGVYEIHFDGLDSDRYHPVPPRRVDVRAGETTDVIIELRRK